MKPDVDNATYNKSFIASIVSFIIKNIKKEVMKGVWI